MTDDLFTITYYARNENIVRVAFNSRGTFAETDFGSRTLVRQVVAATEGISPEHVDVPLSPAHPIVKEGDGYRIVWDVCIEMPVL